MLVSTSFNVVSSPLPSLSPSPCVSRSFALVLRSKANRRDVIALDYLKRSSGSFMRRGWTERGMLVCGSNFYLLIIHCVLPLRLKLRLNFFFFFFLNFFIYYRILVERVFKFFIRRPTPSNWIFEEESDAWRKGRRGEEGLKEKPCKLSRSFH